MRAFLTRRSVAVMGAAVLLAAPAGAQEQKAPTFKTGSLPSDGNNQYVMAVDPDGKVATLYFDGLVNQLDGIGAPLFATRTFSISMPLAGARKGAKLGVFAAGYIARRAGTDASLITIANGRPHVVDFATVSSAPGTPIQTAECGAFQDAKERAAKRTKADAADKGGAKGPQAESDSSFLQCFWLDVSAASDLRINVMLVLSRQTSEAAGYLSVDAIDLQLK